MDNKHLPNNDGPQKSPAVSSGHMNEHLGDEAEGSIASHPDFSAWLIWGGLMLVAIAILPFAVRNHDVVRAIARMCGFDLD